MERESFLGKFKRFLLGKARNPKEAGIFHKLSLTALLAWVGFGLDGISSSCYGPPEAFLGLGGHYYLSFFLAIMIVITVLVISASYMQIIDLFPSGGGGYLVASKLLSPEIGMVSGCALIVDYILTITVSVTAGVEAVFSFLPAEWVQYKVATCVIILILLMILNLRGVKESILPLVPIFMVFLLTHVSAILYAFITHAGQFPTIFHQSTFDFGQSAAQIGTLGVVFLLLHAYSVGSGTYTGIEAVSNGIPLLREPRVENGKKTTIYMALSLSFMAGGLIMSYLFYQVVPQEGKTLNAVLMGQIAQGWPGGNWFVFFAILSEAFILLVAAQTGFLGGPRVIANMALDRWIPYRYALLSDRLVTQNGVLVMGVGAILILLAAKGSVSFLLVLYSINVFLTFTLSQLGMIKHWWTIRKSEKNYLQKLFINGIGFILTSFILVTVIVVKFFEGGWLTLMITGSLAILAALVKRQYNSTGKLLKRLDNLAQVVLQENAAQKVKTQKEPAQKPPKASPGDKTAFILVNGFYGVSLHTLFSVIRTFPNYFKNFVFIQIGLIDAGAFKGTSDIDNLGKSIQTDLAKYVDYMEQNGFYAESQHSFGTDVVDEVEKLTKELVQRFPNSILFTGQLIFQKESWFGRFLHNYAAFAIQKRLYYLGLPVLILPIRVQSASSSQNPKGKASHDGEAENALFIS